MRNRLSYNTPRTANVEPILVIKIAGKMYQSAHTAAKAYAKVCAGNVYYYYGPQTIRSAAQGRHLQELEDRAYRRSYPIFEKYFRANYFFG